MNRSYFKKGNIPWNKGKKLVKVIYSNNYTNSKELFRKIDNLFFYTFIIQILLWYAYIYWLPRNPINTFNIIFTSIYIFTFMVVTLFLNNYVRKLND